MPVQILGSEDEYVLATEKYGKKEYEDADEVLDALVAVEEAYGTEEALRFTYENLKAVS